MVKKIIKRSYYTIDGLPAKKDVGVKTVSKITWYIAGMPAFTYTVVEIK